MFAVDGQSAGEGIVDFEADYDRAVRGRRGLSAFWNAYR